MYLLELLLSNSGTWYVQKPVVVCIPKIKARFLFRKNDTVVFALLENAASTI